MPLKNFVVLQLFPCRRSLFSSFLLTTALRLSDSMDADKHFLSIAPPYNRTVITADVVIAGAGIIGLSTALELARQGLRVTVLDRGHAMAEASWAAAGMLAARDPGNPSELRPLTEPSTTLYCDYRHTIQRVTGL